MCERAGVCHGVPSDGTRLSTSARAQTSCVCVWDPGADSGTVARTRAAHSQKKNVRRARRKWRGRPSFRVRANERGARKLRCAAAWRFRGKNPIGARSDGRAGKKCAGFRAGRQCARERRGPAGLVRAPSADRATDRSTAEPADRHDEGCRRIRAHAESARPRRPPRRAARGCARGRAAAQAAPARRPHRAGKRRGGACALRMRAMRAVS